MNHHTYEGRFEDGRFHLVTDGIEEPPLRDGFRWGKEEADGSTFATAMRILGREVPASAIIRFAGRFEAEVIPRLPGDRPWKLTSTDIRRWMDGQGEFR